ncbi:acyl-CoA dehydrogenase family protein [Saccharopolyspora sp. NPDC050642]|uniref:acyl-CoA dehydrogenase family protein n=1 Tax=Saccharopolyspora sp. NPDC050642 TaxID=3157099 RepID=UPI0033FCA283
MALILTAEQQELQATTRKLLADHSPGSRVRAFVDDSPDGVGGRDELWHQLSEKTGLTGLGLPEECGGTGSGNTELAVVLEEFGRALTPSPFFASVAWAGQALLVLDDEAANRELLPGIAAGTVLASFAPLSTDPAAASHPHAGRDGLTGTAPLVVDGLLADQIVVEALGGDGRTEYHLVDGAAAGLRRTALISTDRTRAIARLDFDRVASRRLACRDGDAARAAITDRAALALAAEQLGGLLRCIEMTVEYAKMRVQFGRLIGSFQAVKHRLADLHTAGELAVSLVRDACRAADEEPDAFPVAARAALAHCSRAYATIAREAIQLHGGIGFTWEHDAHLFYKRAHSSRQLLGGPEQHEAVVADRLAL